MASWQRERKRASSFGLKILLLIGTINDVIERVGSRKTETERERDRVRVGEKLAQSLSVHPKISLDMPLM